jgi:hypothetical protein
MKDVEKYLTRRTILVVALTSSLFLAADWNRFRGPGGSGISEDKGGPVTWSGNENVLWKTEMFGPGSSSPIVVGEKVFVTSYSGYGLSEDNPGDQSKLQYNVACVNLADGKLLWARGVKPALPQTEFKSYTALHGYASSTPASDGENVYAFFGNSGVVALTLDGKPLWRASVGDKIHQWSSGTSPILYKNLVIVNASVESKSIVALDKTNGREVWRVGGIEQSWSTPALADLPDGRQELVVNLKGKVLGLNPETGEKLWECAGINDYVCPSVLANKDVVYVTAGRSGVLLAIRAGGKGDVTASRVLWQIKGTYLPMVPTPLYLDGRLYWVDRQQGKAVCLDARNGEQIYQERVDVGKGSGDKVYASPVYLDGKIYVVTRKNGILVLKAGPQFELLAHNRLDDSSVFNATPAIAGGRLLVRSDKFLYCLGTK